MIISRTPYRISFFGGGTDYPAWYRKHGGAVLSATIDKYCYLSCRYLPPFFEHRIRVVYSKIETCQSDARLLLVERWVRLSCLMLCRPHLPYFRVQACGLKVGWDGESSPVTSISCVGLPSASAKVRMQPFT